MTSIVIESWRPLAKGALVGFVTAKLPSGMVIHDATVLRTNGTAWVSPPGKPMVGSDGTALRDAATGKMRYAQVLSFADKATRDRFSESVIEALRAAYPEALG
jgi:hypothetical protein